MNIVGPKKKKDSSKRNKGKYMKKRKKLKTVSQSVQLSFCPPAHLPARPSVRPSVCPQHNCMAFYVGNICRRSCCVYSLRNSRFALDPKDPLSNAMAEMMERIKTGNIQLKPVRTVSEDFFFGIYNFVSGLCLNVGVTLES